MYRKPLTIASGLLLLCVAAGAAEAPRTVTVAGTGGVEAEPDKARVVMTVQKSNPEMERARDDAVAVTKRFLELARSLGIDPKEIRTSGVMINPQYRWEKQTGQQMLVGYLVQRELEVELTDLGKLGELVEGAVTAGVNNVSPPQLDSSKRRELNRQALAAAAKDAEANAQAVAEILGARLGQLRQLTATDATPPPPPMPRMAVAAMAAESGAETYATGKLRFEAQVSATFDIIAD